MQPEAVRSQGAGWEERELVERMLAGDEEARDAFAARYFPGLLRYAVRRLDGDSELARDLVQTTVCKSLGKLSTFRGEAPLFTWLCACCRNEIAMHFRRRQRSGHGVELDEGSSEVAASRYRTSEDDPERALLRLERAELVHHALDRLPERYARALEWKYLRRLPVRAIARRMQVGEKAAESLLTRARVAFREQWGHIDHGAGRGRATASAGKGGPP